MANVMFKRGPQSNLDTLIQQVANSQATFVDGSFYLTSDTDRLYVAQSATELVELNKSIHIVNSLSDLPTKTSDTAPVGSTKIAGNEVAVGQFYYVKATSGSDIKNTHKGNILAVCSAIDAGGNITWVQVNPDTNENTITNGISFTKSTTASTDNKLVYDVVITQTDKDGIEQAGSTVRSTFTIDASDLNSITGVNVGLTATASSNDVKIGVDGGGADSTNGFITLKKGENVSFDVSGDNVTINAVDTKYGLESPAASTKVSLSENGIEINDVTFEGDGGYISVTGADKDKIKISHGTSGASAGTYGTATAPAIGTAATLETDFGDLVTIPKVTVDNKGHITNVENQYVKMPTYDFNKVNMNITSITAVDDGKIQIGMEDVSGQDHGNTSGSIFYHTITVDGVEQTVYNQKSLGDFYSKTGVDNKLREINALVYKGTVSKASDLPTTNVEAGQTYMVAADGTYSGIDAHVGDLLISTGEEYTAADEAANPAHKAGTLKSVTWTMVPSGNYPDTQYSVAIGGTTNNATVTLQNSVDSAKNESFAVKATDGVINVTSDAATKAITISHANKAGNTGTFGVVDTSAANGQTSIIVPKVTVDAQGHVSAIEDQTVTFKDSQYKISNDNSKSIQLLNLDSTLASKIDLENDSLITVTAGSDKLTFGHANSTAAQGDYGQSADATLAYSKDNAPSTFTVPSITIDSAGHITAIANKTITMPESDDTTYTLSGTVAAKGTDNKAVKLTTALANARGEDSGNAVFAISSESLEVKTASAATGESGAFAVDIVWGSF